MITARSLSLADLVPGAVARFESKYEKSDHCWLWRGGSFTKKGYGLFYARQAGTNSGCTSERAHRVSYAIYNGPIASGELVLHSCDTPACVNPKHLRIGTALENTLEAFRKGRLKAPKIESRLTDAQVREIRTSTLPDGVIGSRFGISRNYVSCIQRGRALKSIAQGE